MTDYLDQRPTYRQFFLSGVLFLLATVVVRHGDDGQDQVDEVEWSHEDNNNEEWHVMRSVRFDHLQQQPICAAIINLSQKSYTEYA